MNGNRYIVEAMPTNFTPLVLGSSARCPVLVYYWSQHAGPCMRLLPRLVKLAAELGGRFLLALLNVDAHPRFARERGIASIPCGVVYQHDTEVETVRGACSETLFRAVIEKYLPALARPTAPLAQPGLAANDQYLVTECRRHLDQAKVMVLRGDPMAAAELLDELPDTAMQDPDINLLRTHFNLIRAAESAPHRDTPESAPRVRPGDHAVRYPLSARLLLEDDYGPAMQYTLSQKYQVELTTQNS